MAGPPNILEILTATSSSLGTSHVLTLPTTGETGPDIDDTLVAFVTWVFEANGTSGTVTASSGWVRRRRVIVTRGTGQNACYELWTKDVWDAPSTVTFTSGSNAVCAAVILVLDSHIATSYTIDDGPSPNFSTNILDHTGDPTLSPARDAIFFDAFCANDDRAATVGSPSSPPSGYTLVSSVASVAVVRAGESEYAEMHLAYRREFTDVTSENPGAWTWSDYAASTVLGNPQFQTFRYPALADLEPPDAYWGILATITP